MSLEWENFKKALDAQGVQFDTETEERVQRAVRVYNNPGACEWCGQHVKVGIYVSKKSGKPVAGHGPNAKFVTACCRTEI